MKSENYPRVIIAAAFLVALLAGLCTLLLIYRPIIRPILDVAPPFVIAIILAFLLDPLIDKFAKKGFSRDFGVAIVGLSFLVIFLLVAIFVVPKIVQQAGLLARNFPDYISEARVQLDKILENEKPMLSRFKLPTTTGALTERFSDQIKTAAENSLSFFASALTAIFSKLIWLVLIPLTTLWFLKDFNYISEKIIYFTPEKYKDGLIQLGKSVGGVFGKYVRGMIAVAILFSAVAMVILSAFGLQYGLIIGSVAGLFYMVPYVGVLIMVLITGITAMVQPPHNFTYAAILMGILIVQSFVVFDLLITPKVVGRSVGVHPILALFALALGARLFGVIGMVLAVPVAASIQVALGQLYPKIYEKVDDERTQEDVVL